MLEIRPQYWAWKRRGTLGVPHGAVERFVKPLHHSHLYISPVSGLRADTCQMGINST